jgi:hypothetical protein
MTIPDDKIRDELIEKLNASIRELFPDAHDIVVSFQTENEVLTLASVRCILCSLEFYYGHVIRSGGTHAEPLEAITLQKFLEMMFSPDERDNHLEFLKRFDSKVKN